MSIDNLKDLYETIIKTKKDASMQDDTIIIDDALCVKEKSGWYLILLGSHTLGGFKTPQEAWDWVKDKLD